MNKKIVKIMTLMMIITVFLSSSALAASGNGGAGGTNGGSSSNTNQQSDNNQGQVGPNQGGGSGDQTSMEAKRSEVQERREVRRAEIEANRISSNQMQQASALTLDAERARIQEYKGLIYEELQIMKQMTEQERLTLRTQLQSLESECKYANRYALELRNAYLNQDMLIGEKITDILPCDLTSSELEAIEGVVADLD